jgi:phage host-nuclease inhibitor protein Gam
MSDDVTQDEAAERAAIAAEHEITVEDAAAEGEAAAREAERLVNQLLGVKRGTLLEMDRNRALHRDEVSRADKWLTRINAPKHKRIFFLDRWIRAVAEYVPFPGKAKSRNLPRGVVGFRTRPERLVVEDPDAALAWAKARNLETNMEETVPHAVLVKAWKEERGVPAGCTVVPAEETFYADPSEVA